MFQAIPAEDPRDFPLEGAEGPRVRKQEALGATVPTVGRLRGAVGPVEMSHAALPLGTTVC